MVAKRIGLLFAIFFVLLGVAGARSAYLATVKGDTLKRAAAVQQVNESTVPARRGAIVDRQGVQLAVTQSAADVSATPYLVEDPTAAAKKLAPLLRKTEDDVLRALARRDTGFVYLARAMPADKAQKVADLKIAGIALTPTIRRTYPQKWLASQVLGYVGTDNKGLAGLEQRFDEQLRGKDGTRRIVRDPHGQTLSLEDVDPARTGETLELNLDAQIQGRTEQVLKEVGAQFKPKGATAIVMDPRTGALLAVANWPRVDANAPLSQSPDYAHQNRAVGFTYEPGSTFKAMTVAGALQDGKVTPKTMFDLPAKITIYDRTVGESHRTEAITADTTQILAQSSNVGAIKIGGLDGEKNFAKWVDRFGFGKVTGADLPGEERGIVPRQSEYSGTSMANLPLGQGLSVTPMQLTVAYAAIANGGRLVTPQIVRRVGDAEIREPRGRRVITRTTARQLSRMLEDVFDDRNGTAHLVTIPGYKLAGKTGTANKVDPTTGLYSEAAYVASFVGYAPARNPRLLVSVVVDEPQSDIYGGTVAAPAFGEIMRSALSYLQIPPS